VELKHADITKAIIGLFFQVYRNAMAVAGRKLGLEIVQEVPIRVHFDSSVSNTPFKRLAMSALTSE